MEQATGSAFARHTAVHNSGAGSAAGPESPRLFSAPSLPETPPAQMLQTAVNAPPVRRTRSMNLPPAASHPVLASAFAVAGTGAPDISQAPARLPTQRQLQLGPLFAFPLLPGPQEPIPFPSSASKTKPASLLEKVNSLLGPKEILRSIIAERHNSLSLQDSSMLSDMLRRTAPLHTDTEGPVAATSAGCASSQAGISDDTGRPSRSGAKALPPKVGMTTRQKLEDFTHSAASPTTSSYLTSSRSAFGKSRLQTHKRARVMNSVALASNALSHLGVLQQGAFMPSGPPAKPVLMSTGDTGPKATPTASPFLGLLVPALPWKGADRALPGYAQGHYCSSWTMLEGPTGQGSYTGQGTYKGPLETAHGPLQNSPNGCCISLNQHHHLAAANRFPKQASHDSPVQKRSSTPPFGNNVETHSTCNKQQQLLRSVTTGSKAALQNSTGVFQTPAAGPISPPAYDPYSRAVSHCPKGHSKLPFPAGQLEGNCANDNSQSPAQAVQLEKARAIANSLECRLVFPHGSRSHKRPRLEDRLTERHLMVAKHWVTARASDTPTATSMF